MLEWIRSSETEAVVVRQKTSCDLIERALFYALNLPGFGTTLKANPSHESARLYAFLGKSRRKHCAIAIFARLFSGVKNMASSKIVVHNTKCGLMSYIRPMLRFKTKI